VSKVLADPYPRGGWIAKTASTPGSLQRMVRVMVCSICLAGRLDSDKAIGQPMTNVKVDGLATASPDAAGLPRENNASVSGNGRASLGVVNLANLPTKERADNEQAE